MRLAVVVLIFLGFVLSAIANQAQLGSPTTGTVSGVQLTTNYNGGLDALASCNSGTAAPANAGPYPAGAPDTGQCWLNTSTTPNTLNIYDGTNWLTKGWIDTVNHIWIPVVGGGQALTSIASASTTNLCPSPVSAAVATAVEVTGTTTITSFGTQCVPGQIKLVFFQAALVLTNSASLVLPTGANITTAAGDFGEFVYVSGVGWYNFSYQRFSGASLSTGAASVNSASLLTGAQSYAQNTNAAISASVATNNLTINLITNDTAVTPTAADPVLIPFQVFGASDGQYTILKATAAVSFTINSGNTMGATSGTPFRLWIVAINNSGTLLIGAYMASTPTSCKKVDEGTQITTGSGTNGGSTAQVVQTSVSSATNVQVKTLGYMEWSSGLVTAGTWNATPTLINVAGTGIKLPCDIMQITSVSSGGTIGITPSSAADPVLINANVAVTMNGAGTCTTTLKRGATNVPGGAVTLGGGSSTSIFGFAFPNVFDFPGAITAQTYTENVTGAGCGSSAGASMTAMEIMGAIDAPVPANDNDLELRMIG